MRAICPITSIGATNIVVYSRNDTNTPADSGCPLPNNRGTASTHTSTVVACTANISSGQNVVHSSMDAVELVRHVVVPVDEPVDLTRLLVERLHHANARNRVRQDVRHARPLPPRRE